jgi:hypothetical protein
MADDTTRENEEPRDESAGAPEEPTPPEKEPTAPPAKPGRSSRGIDEYRESVRRRKDARNRKLLIGAAVAGGLAVIGGLLYFLLRSDLGGQIVLPFIAHQKPAIDPHLPHSNALSDKLDEVQFDGLFNLSADPSGVVYRDGLGELLGIDSSNVVSVRLKANRKWHDSWRITVQDDEVSISPAQDHVFSAKDLDFTLRRIQSLGSLSPDYILVSQALDPMTFDGPDQGNVIRMRFKGDRIWKEADIKEVLSFKILPANSPMNALTYAVGTASYAALPPADGVSNYHRSPDGGASIPLIRLAPFVDNSTYSTELRNGSINVLLDTPFGSLSPILADGEEFFTKSNISTTFFAVLFNTQRLTREQRVEIRKLFNSQTIVDRFFKVGTEQQRHIVDYRNLRDNYIEYINASVFPSTSYYVEEEIVTPARDTSPPNLAVLPDTIRLRASANYGFREEYADLLAILNDPAVTRGRVRALAVQNEDIVRGNYDALLIAISGYRSTFLFDLYDVFLREPNLETYRVSLQTTQDASGATVVTAASLQPANNFCRLDAAAGADAPEVAAFLNEVYAFMSTRYIGDKQEYARRVHAREQSLALGAWLFSLPSLAYFSTQFDSSSIDLYGVASQLSTIHQWKENPNY